MVSTKHCCWGTWNSDSRYPDKLHKSMKQMLELGMKILIPFPKPSQGIERCQRSINACPREHFTISEITRNTYICTLHWPGQRGPTVEFPDSLKANFTAREVFKASRPKRKAPQPRALVNKWCFDTLKISYSDSGVNSHRLKSTKITVEPLLKYLMFVQKCQAILNNVLFCFFF